MAHGIFSVMLGEAVRQGLILVNPCEKVSRLKNDRKNLGLIITAVSLKPETALKI